MFNSKKINELLAIVGRTSDHGLRGNYNYLSREIAGIYKIIAQKRELETLQLEVNKLKAIVAELADTVHKDNDK